MILKKRFYTTNIIGAVNVAHSFKTANFLYNLVLKNVPVQAVRGDYKFFIFTFPVGMHPKSNLSLFIRQILPCYNFIANIVPYIFDKSGSLGFAVVV